MDPFADGGVKPKLLALSEAYSRHKGALRASLRAEYGIREMRLEAVSDLVDYVSWLPPGSALWRSYGGPLSQPNDVRVLEAVEFRLRELAWMQSKDAQSGRNRPKPPKPVPYAHEADAEADAMRRKGAAFMARQTAS